jgi:chromatin structure-remodeling complex subunit RSC1/2
MTPQMPQQSMSPAPQYQRQNSYHQASATPLQPVTPQPPHTQPTYPYAAQQQLHAAPALPVTHAQGFVNPTPVQSYQPRPQAQPISQPYPSQGSSSNIHDQRVNEVFILSDNANALIPEEIRQRFPQDEQGHVLFFTKPPVLPTQVIHGKNDTARAKGEPPLLAHSEKYLAAKAERQKAITSRKHALANDDQGQSNNTKRTKTDAAAEKDDKEQATKALADTLNKYIDKMNADTVAEYKELYGDKWEEYRKEDQERAKARAEREAEAEKKRAEVLSKCRNLPEYDTKFSRSLWGGKIKGERY